MLEPRSRSGDSRVSCGTQYQQYKRYLAETDTRQMFHWLTKVPHPNGICKFTIGPNPADMQVLRPRSREANQFGEFECGRKYGYDSVEFKMPQTKCEDCVIELLFSYGAQNQQMYQCSDIRLTQMKPLPSVKRANSNNVKSVN